MRLQIILQLRPNPRIGLFFEKIPEVFLPVLWFDAEAAIDEEMASQVPWPQFVEKRNFDTVSFWKNLLEISIPTSVFFFQVKMLAVMPTAGLLFGVISLAGAALCLVLFLYLRLDNGQLQNCFEWGNFHNNCIFRQKKVTNSVTPSAHTAEKVDISIAKKPKRTESSQYGYLSIDELSKKLKEQNGKDLPKKLKQYQEKLDLSKKSDIIPEVPLHNDTYGSKKVMKVYPKLEEYINISKSLHSSYITYLAKWYLSIFFFILKNWPGIRE